MLVEMNREISMHKPNLKTSLKRKRKIKGIETSEVGLIMKLNPKKKYVINDQPFLK